MLTDVTHTSRIANRETQTLQHSQAERLARYILSESEAGESVWLRKAARHFGWEANSAGRALNALKKGVYVRIDQVLYRMEEQKTPQRDPVTGKLGDAWRLVRYAKPASNGVQVRMLL